MVCACRKMLNSDLLLVELAYTAVFQLRSSEITGSNPVRRTEEGGKPSRISFFFTVPFFHAIYPGLFDRVLILGI